MASADWHRLAAYVTDAREALGYTSRQRFADAAGISLRKLNDLETGKPVGAHVLSRIQLALGWTATSCQAVLDGGVPMMREHQVAAGIIAAVEQMAPDAQAAVRAELAGWLGTPAAPAAKFLAPPADPAARDAQAS